MKIIDGKTLAENLRKNIANEVKQYSRPPGLAVLLVGDDQASQVYVRNKSRACVEVGFYSDQIHKSANITQEELLSEVQRLNENNNIDGILVQLPLPSHIDANEIIEAIIPEKDVDGFSSENVGKLSLNKPFISPCTPKGVIKMLDSIKCDLRGKDCVIIGASNIVGRPMAWSSLMRERLSRCAIKKPRTLNKKRSQRTLLSQQPALLTLLTVNGSKRVRSLLMLASIDLRMGR